MRSFGVKRSGVRWQRKVITLAVAAAFGTEFAHAAPVAPVVVNGQASFVQAGKTLSITNTPGAIINWRSFSIAQDETTRFIQQSAASTVLNRVTGVDPSQILGTLQSNGRVFLINPNGIVFGAGAQIDVAGLVVSSLNLSNADFLAGRLRFTDTPGAGTITNQGAIKASGGPVYIVAPNVENSGTITTVGGDIILAAGKTVQLVDPQSPDVRIEVSAPANQAVNLGQLLAERGHVGIYAGMIRNSGTINATGASLNEKGEVVLVAKGDITLDPTSAIAANGPQGGSVSIKSQDGTTWVAGTIAATGSQGNGGFVETSGSNVNIADGARVDTTGANGITGTWLIDPTTIYIALNQAAATAAGMTGTNSSANTGPSNFAASGAVQDSLLTTGALAGALAGTNVTVTTTNASGTGLGDINVVSPVIWSANTTLTLSAVRNINVNSNITATGNTAALNLYYGGTNGTTAPAANTGFNLGAGASVTLSGTTPSLKIGNQAYTVINSLGGPNDTSGTTLQGMNGNLGGFYALGRNIDAMATSTWDAGEGFAPIGNGTTSFTGTFNGLGHAISNLTINRPMTDYVGLFGYTEASAISNVGLVGVSVSGSTAVGALVGVNIGGAIRNTFATGSVSGPFSIGGLVGENYGSIINSYATGAATGSFSVGGLVGFNGGNISYTYAAGNVSGTSGVGGLAGQNSGTISTSYAAGSVTGTSSVGGFAGNNTGTVTTSYWNTTTSGTSTGIASGTNVGVTGLTTTQMQTASNFAGFTFTTTPGASGNAWVMVDADGRLNNAGGVAGATFPMLASEYATTIVNAHQLQLMAMNLAGNYTLGANINASATANGLDVWGSAGFVPIGNATTKFTGSLAGQGYTINALYINRPATNFVGLFGYTTGMIGNVNLTNASITGNSIVGGLAGENDGTITTQSASSSGNVTGITNIGGLVGQNAGTGTITGTAPTTLTVSGGTVTGTTNVGGLVGYNNSIASNSINNASSSATVNVNAGTVANIGGLVGQNAGTILANSATGVVTGGATSSNVGGLVGLNVLTGTITSSSHTTGSVSGGYAVGGLVGENDSTIQTLSASSSGNVTGTSEVGGLVGYNVGTITGTAPTTQSVSGGIITGTSNVGGLVGYNGGDVNNSSSSATVNGTGTATNIGGLVGLNSWTIGGSSATGVVNGGATSTDVGGLVGLNMNGGAITNSFHTTGNISGNSGVGGLVGENDGTITTQLASSNANVTGTTNVGGLVGVNTTVTGTITGNAPTTLTVSGGTVTGTTNVGGLVGYNSSTAASAISNSSSAATVNVNAGTVSNIGGLVGQNAGTMLTSTATGAVNGGATSNNVGGLVGYNAYPGAITNSFHTTGAVTGTTQVGGLAGGNTGTIQTQAASSSGNVTGTSYVGGLVGYNGGTITGNAPTTPTVSGGTVTGTGYVGGLVGLNAGILSNASSSATVNSTGSVVGGLVGWNEGTILNSSATGVVTGGGATSSDVGGLVGRNVSSGYGTGAITNSFHTTGAVTGVTNVGGLVGENIDGIITQSTSSGTVAGTTNVGGLVGSNFGIINNSSSTSAVNGNSGSNTGGLVGQNAGEITNSFHTTGNVAGGSNVGGLVGENDGTIQTQSTSSSGNVTGTNYVGGLVGANKGSIAGTAQTTLTVNGGTVTGNQYIGGLVGYNYSGVTISNSSSAATVGNSNSTYVGGLVGENDGTITQSTSSGNVTGSGNVGGLVGYNFGAINNSSSTSAVNGNSGSNTGGLVGQNAGTITASFHTTGNVTGGGNVGGLVGFNGGQVDGSSYAGGSVNGGSGVGGVIGAGNFGGYSVGSSVSGVTNVGGLGGSVNSGGATISASSSGTVTGTTDVGGLFGLLESNSPVTNGSSSATVTGNAGGSYVGGLVGKNNSTITTSTFSGLVTGDSNVGGIAGWNAGTITSSTSSGLVSGNAYVGGLAGINTGTMTGTLQTPSANDHPVTGTQYVGGLVGLNSTAASAINNASNTGSVTGNANSTYIGGLVGKNEGTIAQSRSSGTISGVTQYAGGLIGYNTGVVTNAHYNVDAVLINGGHVLTTGGLYDAQFTAWSSGQTLNIANYAATLPFDGTSYVVSSVQGLKDMLAFADVSSYKFRLGTSIDLSSAPELYIPYFSALSFSGGGNVISNLSLNRPNQSNVGLFGFVQTGSTITNLAVSNASVTGLQNVGGLVGYNAGTLSNDYAAGSVSGGPGSSNIGGLVGQSAGTISNSYTTSSVSVGGGANIGGLVGYNSTGAAISTTYAAGSVTATSAFGGFAGFNGGTVSNSYWNTTTSGTSTGIASGNNAGATGRTTAQMQTASNFAGFTFTTTPGASGNAWVMVDADGSLNNVGGATGATFPMLASEYSTTIVNAHQLQLMTMNLAGNYTLGANINASATAGGKDVWGSAGSTMGFAPIGNAATKFTGSLAGSGYTINALFINRPTTNYIGLFGYSTGTISNVNLTNASVAGLLAVGGLAGQNNGTITQSTSSGAVAGAEYVGGLVGISSGTIQNQSATSGTVTGTDYVGGLVGYNKSTAINAINNASSAATVNGTGTLTTNIGGLVGYNAGAISNSYSAGPVAGTSNVGGLVGYNTGTVSNAHYNADAVLINGGHLLTTGGLYNTQYTGWSSGQTLNIASYATTLPFDGTSYVVSSVQGLKDMLGFADVSSYKFRLGASIDLSSAPGFYIPYFSASSFSGGGNVISNLSLYRPNQSNVGLFGFVQTGSTVTNLTVSNSSVTGLQNAGVVAGYNAGAISSSHAAGSVSGSTFIGGLVGQNRGTISNSDATSSVSGGSGSSYVGGLAGANTGTISNTYTAGNVSGITTIAAMVSNNSGPVTASYLNTTTFSSAGIGGGTLTGATGLTIAAMQTNSSFNTWNVTTATSVTGYNWGMVAGDGTLNNVLAGATFPMLASEYSSTIVNVNQLQLMVLPLTEN